MPAGPHLCGCRLGDNGYACGPDHRGDASLTQEQSVCFAGPGSSLMLWIDLLHACCRNAGREERLGFSKCPLYALEAIAMMRLLLQWVLSALSLMMVAKLLPGFHIKFW